MRNWFSRRRIRAVSMGDLRKFEPVSQVFGADRGTTIRRVYIDQFFDLWRSDLHGHILEIGDSRYARAFGAADVSVGVLDPDLKNPVATICGDLLSGEGVPAGVFDAAILTQVLHVLPDMGAALRTVHRALKPGGILLATVPGITQVSRYDMDRWGDYWRVTDMAAKVLINENFPSDSVEVRAFGNHLSAIAALTGLAAEELTADEINHCDPDYQVLVGIRARKVS